MLIFDGKDCSSTTFTNRCALRRVRSNFVTLFPIRMFSESMTWKISCFLRHVFWDWWPVSSCGTWSDIFSVSRDASLNLLGPQNLFEWPPSRPPADYSPSRKRKAELQEYNGMDPEDWDWVRGMRWWIPSLIRLTLEPNAWNGKFALRNRKLLIWFDECRRALGYKLCNINLLY